MSPNGPTSVVALSTVVLFLLLPSAFTASLLRDDPPSSALPTPGDPPCTITSPSTGSFFDLRPLIRTPPSDTSAATPPDWTASGHDYNATFFLNVCEPVLSDVPSIHGIPTDSPYHSNISAFYTYSDNVAYSLGTANSVLLLRGRKLLLEYHNGSPCPGGGELRKSALISFLCDREMSPRTLDMAFVGHGGECAYFFEVRSREACATSKRAVEEGLSPGAIFAVIMAVVLAVYIIGGCVYQRTVMNARGWRQVPHYHTWAKLVRGVVSILACLSLPFLLCHKHTPHTSHTLHTPSSPPTVPDGSSAFSRRLSALGSPTTGGWGGWGGGGRTLWGSNSRWGGGTYRQPEGESDEVDDENRLLDQLEGEWDD